MQVFPCKLRFDFKSSCFWLALAFACLQVCVPGSTSQAQEIERESSRKTVQKIAPAYPEIAKTLKLSGKVRILAKVAPSGKVIATEVVGGHPVLARAAADAVLQWRYEPAHEETKEVAVITFQP